jgi:hypothetical protein
MAPRLATQQSKEPLKVHHPQGRVPLIGLHAMSYYFWLQRRGFPVRDDNDVGRSIFLGAKALLSRAGLGLTLIAMAPWAAKPFMGLATIYTTTWAPAAVAGAYYGWPVQRRHWALLPVHAAAELSVWLRRAALAAISGWRDSARPVWSRIRVRAGATMLVIIALGLLLPNTRTPTLAALALAMAALILLALAAITRLLLPWVVRLLLTSPRWMRTGFAAMSRVLERLPGAMHEVGLGLLETPLGGRRLLDYYRVWRWLGSADGNLDGQQLLMWAGELRSPAGFNRLLSRLEARQLLVGRPDAVAALGDLTVVIEQVAAGREWSGQPGFRCPATVAWLDRLDQRGRKRLAALDGEHLDRAGQFLERLQIRPSTKG